MTLGALDTLLKQFMITKRDGFNIPAHNFDDGWDLWYIEERAEDYWLVVLKLRSLLNETKI